jgi:uncharacterized protein YjiS (DUF1127 family)
MPQHLPSKRPTVPGHDPVAAPLTLAMSGTMTNAAAPPGAGAGASVGVRTEAATEMAPEKAIDVATDITTDMQGDMKGDMGAVFAAVVRPTAVAGFRPVSPADARADPRGAATSRVAADRRPPHDPCGSRDHRGGAVTGGIPPRRPAGAAPASRAGRWIAALRRLATRWVAAWSAAARRRRTRIRLAELDDRRLADIGLRRIAPLDPPIRLDRNW